MIVHAPNTYSLESKPGVFLAGSIEMGKAIDWQTDLAARLTHFDCVILNPRRPDWDASWAQSVTNPQFVQQVQWELNGLDRADVVAMYLAPGTQSPISLLEFGLFAASGKMVVYCPEGFWRKGNIDITAHKYDVPVYADYEAFVEAVVKRVENVRIV